MELCELPIKTIRSGKTLIPSHYSSSNNKENQNEIASHSVYTLFNDFLMAHCLAVIFHLLHYKANEQHLSFPLEQVLLHRCPE